MMSSLTLKTGLLLYFSRELNILLPALRSNSIMIRIRSLGNTKKAMCILNIPMNKGKFWRQDIPLKQRLRTRIGI